MGARQRPAVLHVERLGERLPAPQLAPAELADRVVLEVVAPLVAECAALALADHERGRPQCVRGLDLRYLSAASHGPVIGHAAWIGDAATGTLRVEARDHGQGEALSATALVQVTDAPDP